MAERHNIAEKYVLQIPAQPWSAILSKICFIGTVLHKLQMLKIVSIFYESMRSGFEDTVQPSRAAPKYDGLAPSWTLGKSWQ